MNSLLSILALGRAQRVPRGELERKWGAGRWRTVVAKRANGAERAGNMQEVDPIQLQARTHRG